MATVLVEGMGARELGTSRVRDYATCDTTWAYQLQHIDALPVYFLKHNGYKSGLAAAA